MEQVDEKFFWMGKFRDLTILMWWQWRDLLLLLLAIGEAFSTPIAQSVSTQWHYLQKVEIKQCVCNVYGALIVNLVRLLHLTKLLFYYYYYYLLWWAVLSSLFLIRRPHCALPCPFSPIHTGQDTVDHWSFIPTGTLVKQTVITPSIKCAHLCCLFT